MGEEEGSWAGDRSRAGDRRKYHSFILKTVYLS
jgi:hypothetical protein